MLVIFMYPLTLSALITRPSFRTAALARGDTLWDTADNYLGNPFRYPELAKLSHIKDPHWIYPGDIITIIRK